MEMKENNYEWQLMVLTLKEIASDKKITHEMIAERAGMARDNVTRFFSAKHKPNLDMFLTIAKTIGVYFYFEDKDGTSDLTRSFDRAMTELGRRGEIMSRN